MSVILNGNTFTTWDDVEQELFTPEEIAESNLRAALICEIIKARQEHGITPREAGRTERHKAIYYCTNGERLSNSPAQHGAESTGRNGQDPCYRANQPGKQAGDA